ncbi:MAG: DUF2938 family protein [Gemmatimonadaceae bacterium]|nr:DUF2938 family protein [Gemmatimonadaceae bacterium]MCW5826860.1 DUF2938 family protein [Gemmatimonadaceae bacterium]
MSPMLHAAAAVALGAGATAAIDAWNYALRRVAGIASLNYCLLDRWVSHLRHGVFRHRSIADAELARCECTLGWIAHYGIGIALAAVFVGAAGADWLLRPTVLPALGFGVVTVALPFFVLQPALGLGLASSATRDPLAARIKSLATHSVYGLGLYACARVLSAWLFA